MMQNMYVVACYFVDTTNPIARTKGSIPSLLLRMAFLGLMRLSQEISVSPARNFYNLMIISLKSNVMKTTTLLFITILISGQGLAQSFTTYEKMSEFEAQRYLMTEIYDVSSEQIDELRIDFTYKEVDPEGFIFRLTSYEFNGKQGVVITSLNTHDVIGDLYEFQNIHLTRKEFEDLNQKFSLMEMNIAKKNTNYILRFNEQLIFEVSRSGEASPISYNLWVEGKVRHSLYKDRWNTAFNRFQKFMAE
jgi:hypothetical protein